VDRRGLQDQGGGTAWVTLERILGEDSTRCSAEDPVYRRSPGLKKFSESLETRRGFSNSLFVLK
jgi:hypothetical protein